MPSEAAPFGSDVNPWKNPRFFGQVCAKVQTSKRYLDDLPVLSGFAPDQFSCLAVSNRLRERIKCCISITFWLFSPQISLLLNGLSILFLHFDGFDCYLANIFWIRNQVVKWPQKLRKHLRLHPFRDKNCSNNTSSNVVISFFPT